MGLVMRSVRGGNLRPVSIEPNTEDQDPPADTSQPSDSMSQGSSMDDLMDLPDAPKPIPAKPGRDSNAVHNTDDLDDLPDAAGSLGKIYEKVYQGDPDHVAKVLDTSSKLDADPILVAGSLKEATQQAKAPDAGFFRSVEAQYPGTTKFLQIPQNMAVAHDDVDNIAKHEQLITGIKKAVTISDSLKAGWQSSATGLFARGQMPDTELPPDAPIWNRLAAQAAGLVSDFPLMVQGAGAGAAVGATTGATALGAVGLAFPPAAVPLAGVGAAGGAIIGGGAGAFAEPAAIKAALRLQYEKGNIKGVADAVDRGGDVLKEATKQGLVGGLTSAVGGAVAAPFESAAAKALAPAIFGSLTLKAVAPLVAEDIAMTRAGNAAEGKETSIQDYVDGALLIGAMHGATSLGAKTAEHYVEAKKTAQAVQFYEGLGETGGASKLLTRLQPGYEFMLGSMAKGSPIQNILVPKEDFQSYFQGKNIDPENAAQTLGATEAGENLSIPIEKWVSNLVKTEHYQGLKNDIKFADDGLTVNQVKAAQDDIKEQVNQAEAAAPGLQAQNDSTGRIYQERQQQLEAAGVSPVESRMAATLHSEAFRTLGERMGADPYVLAQRFKLEVQRHESAGSTEGRAFSQIPLPDSVKIHSIEGEIPSVEEARKSFPKGEVTNEHTGWAIAFSAKGEKKARQTTGTDENRLAYANIGELMKNAVLAKSEPDRLGRDKDIQAVHTFYAPFEHGDKNYIASIKVKETKDGNKFYDKFALENKNGATAFEHLDQTRAIEAADAGESNGKSQKPQSLNINDFLQNVKKLQEGDPFFQGEQGKITFQRERAVIDLFKTANRSTFLHESGHYFLEVMQGLASQENAPQQIKDDVRSIRDWMGLKDGEAIGEPQHEQFARGFEAYLREGKAPSAALASAFQKFKAWLTQIYRSIRHLNVELSPEIRGVMDRMLATDEEISRAQDVYKQASGFDVPDSVRPKMDNLAFQAREQAETQLMKEQMQELTSERKDFLKSERKRLTDESEKQVQAEPVYQAIDYIKSQVGDRKNIEKMAQKMVEGKLDDETAAHFETAAEMQGVFADGKDLALNIVNNKATDHFNKSVQDKVESGMAEHADLMSKAKIKDRALELVHNDKRAELLALERSILSDKIKQTDTNTEVSRRSQIEARIQAQAAKEQAHEILSAKPIRDAGNFRIYTTAERNAAVKSARAIQRKDFEAASEYKRQQMLNHALASEAMRNRAEAEKRVGQLQEAASRGQDMKNMPYAFNRQIDQLLERFGIKPREVDDQGTQNLIAKDMQSKQANSEDIANATGQIIDKQTGQFRPENFREFIERQNYGYRALQVPETVYSGGVDDYRDLKMQDLRDVSDTVKLLTKLGRTHDRFLNDFIRIDMNEAARKLKGSIEENIGSPYAEKRKIGSQYNSALKEAVDRIKTLPDRMISTMVNTLTLTHYLDGGEAGPATELLYRPLKQAEDRKFARLEKMREELTGDNGLMSKFYTPKELGSYKTERIQFGDRWLTKENVLSMALNWGNEQNRDRIRAGFGARDGDGRLVPLSEDAIGGLFKNLSKKDWDFSQAIWDHLDTYWPEIAALEMKTKGVEPERVVPSAFDNEHGSYRGGYYPIAHDFEKSNEAFKNAQQLTEEFQQYSSAAAHTNRGHALSREQFVARPIRLSTSVLFNHLENVIHDLEFRAPIIDAAKFMNMPDVRTSIQDAIGQDGYRGMTDWVKSLGSNQSENLTWLDKAMQWSRFGATISTLGMTPKAFLLHMPSNVFNSMWEIGVQRTTRMMTRAALDVAMGRGELKDFVFSRSERMKQRLEVRDRDIMEMAKKWEGSAAGVIPHYAFMSLHLADEAVSIPLWSEIYRSNVAEMGDQKARDVADETVTRTLGSGSKVDQTGFQRGSQRTKLFTMFYSWMSVMFNRAWMDGKVAGLEYKQGNLGKAAAVMAKATFFAWALPAVHEALLSQAMTNKQGASPLVPQTNDEKKRFAAKIIEAPFSMVPFVRDIVPPMIHQAMGEHGGDMRISPVETALENIYKPVADGTNILFGNGKHLDEKYAEEVAHGASQVLGYPQQLNTWAFNFFDYMENNGEASMKDFLSRRHLEKK